MRAGPGPTRSTRRSAPFRRRGSVPIRESTGPTCWCRPRSAGPRSRSPSTPRPRARAALLIVSAFALYRAVLFIHELTHLAPRDVPAFRAVWNALVGVPLLIPSFLYEGVHTDHHRQRCYGTPARPGIRAVRPPPADPDRDLRDRLAGVPLLLAVRFALVAPMSWIVPAAAAPHGRTRCSALVINQRYVRRAAHRRAVALVAGSGRMRRRLGRVRRSGGSASLPLAALGGWLFVERRRVGGERRAHARRAPLRSRNRRRRRDDDGRSAARLVHDRPAARRRRLDRHRWRGLWAPVGLRFHALHHWIPSLPYHNLARAHRLLVETLAADEPYAATQYPAIAPVVVDLVRRSSQHRG